jgi:transposase
MGSDTIDKDFDKACGVDVHRDLFVATILSNNGEMSQRLFCTTQDGLFSLRDWLLENRCRAVAFESTGVYWKMLYRVLEGVARVWVANPFKIKKPGKKTDKVDSEWLARLCLKGMITPSRVFGGVQERLRELTRYRESLVRGVSQYKNRVHRLLESCCVKLGSVLSDVFGSNGRKMLDDLLAGKSVDDIIKSIRSKRVKKKEEELRKALSYGLDPVSVLLIKDCLSRIQDLEYAIQIVDSQIRCMLDERLEDIRILMSIPGMGFVSASAVLAEIGEIRDFREPGCLASWCGMVPSVYQSAGKLVTGRITKQGSKHVRRMLVQIAHVIAKMDNRLSVFYHRIKEKKGSKKAAVALARKLLCIIHHLLTNREKYEEPAFKPKKINIPKTPQQATMTQEEMIQTLIKAGYEIRKNHTQGVT